MQPASRVQGNSLSCCPERSSCLAEGKHTLIQNDSFSKSSCLCQHKIADDVYMSAGKALIMCIYLQFRDGYLVSIWHIVTADHPQNNNNKCIIFYLKVNLIFQSKKQVSANWNFSRQAPIQILSTYLHRKLTGTFLASVRGGHKHSLIHILQNNFILLPGDVFISFTCSLLCAFTFKGTGFFA